LLSSLPLLNPPPPLEGEERKRTSPTLILPFQRRERKRK